MDYGGNRGTVFELSLLKQKRGAWTEKILHSFVGGTDGANPNGGFISSMKMSCYLWHDALGEAMKVAIATVRSSNWASPIK